MDQLPLEIVVYILQYLSKEEHIKVSKVNTKFREAIFAPSLWPEDGESMRIPTSQVTSFTKFLKQGPNFKHLNVLFYGSVRHLRYRRSIRRSINLETVFKPLDYLQCLTLSFDGCTSDTIYLPRSLKHLSLRDHGPGDTDPFINDDLLKSIADSCPQLEHFQIKSIDHPVPPFYSSKGLGYLLKKVNETLRSFILLEDISEDFCSSRFSFFDCPPNSNLTTLCVNIDLHNYYGYYKFSKLPNFENLQILSLNWPYCTIAKNPLADIFTYCSLKNLRFLALSCYTICNDIYAALSKVPNLQVLYMYSMHRPLLEFEPLLKFLRGCDSLKVFAWFSKFGYTENVVPALEKLKKETSLKIYLSFSCDDVEVYHFPNLFYPSFPSEYFDHFKTFKYLMNDIFFEKSHYFSHCHSPFLKNIKEFIGP